MPDESKSVEVTSFPERKELRKGYYPFAKQIVLAPVAMPELVRIIPVIGQ
jgi:hypothetical protein